MKKITVAEQRKLEDLYARLKSAWMGNRIEALKDTLAERSLAFRQIQSEIASDCEAFKQSTTTQFTTLIQEHWDELRAKVQIWKDDINQKKASLSRLEINWPSEKQTTFNVGIVSLKGLRKRLSELRVISKDLAFGDQQLRADEQILTTKQNLLSDKLQILSEQQKRLASEETPYQQFMSERQKTLIVSFNVKKQKSEQILTQKKADLTASLTKLTATLEVVTSDTESKLLMQLGNEIANEHPDWPDELKNYLRQADLSALLRKKNATLEACKQLESGLKRELGGSGYNVDQFLSLMERNVD